METNNRNVKNEIAEKLSDETLRGSLGRFAEAYPTARAKAYENVEDIDALREQVRQMKIGTVAEIEKVADKFEAEAIKRGAKVFRAKDGDALKKYLLDLCEEKGVKRIVKSKSMASEEILLNHTLEDAGLHVKETDLGEWIISLAGHKPSHMVMPAIHLNRDQVAGYFSKELKQEIPNDIPFMVQAARQNLRKEFLLADMGISGANFGIAENSAIGLVTNEGNARLVTTLPKIHVVIMGYEKLIPTIKDAAPILRTLPRNATGQLMTSYMTMTAGQTPVMVKKDGKWVEEKKELHIILLDNGRLKAAHDDKFKEIYQCVRCASCLNVCPIYTLVGGHVYGHIYSGGIGAILTALLNSQEDFDKINELCIGCRKCVEICPGKINIPGLIDELRSQTVKEKGLPFGVRMVFENVLANRKVFHNLLRLASIGQKPFTTGNVIRHLPLFLAGMAKDRSLPAVADVPLRDRISKITKKITRPTKRVAFFAGCNTDFVFPETGEAVYKVLQDLKMEVVFPEDQSCCGKPLLGMGDREIAKKIAKRNIIAFEEAKADVILSSCPTCTETWHETYLDLFADDAEWKARAEKLAHKFREFTSFVAEHYEKAGRLKKVAGGKKVTYHDSCHAKRGLGISKEPRALLAASKGYDLVEMKDCDKCCGMAGAFGIKYTEISMPILKQKITNIKDTGAEIIAVGCPACMMQIQGGLDKQAPHIKVKHVAQLLAEDIKD
ncbi:L-lactate dehydrogenase (quinone) large subunit LdhH [Pelosinus sp. sgz500959]|uniref:L-lactate dehydrogenase (quinone) large subunit LdhH n=1 Tax=Pelosinus sp. sgz500959 TaxID=3242472 RepID=UPI00366E9175